MTMREVDFSLGAISRRRHQNVSLQASFHGIKIPAMEIGPTEISKLTPAQEAAFARALEESQKLSPKERDRRGHRV